MELNFRDTFLQICKENQVQPQESILGRLEAGPLHKGIKSQMTLDLSTSSLSPGTCEALGKSLATNHHYTELQLSDCMIGDDGVRPLVQGLLSNVSVRSLDLKGNNLRGPGCEALGKLLRHNHALKRLCLEWNSLGLDSLSLTLLVEGLAANTSLQELDLRSNQIHQDSATVLAKALCRNSTLDTLDLRWNTIGLVGGRALMNCLQHNRSLVKLQLAGNNIPQDMINAIDGACRNNSERLQLSTTHQTREQLLAREMRHTKQERNKEVTDLMRRIHQQGEQLGKNERNSIHRINQLQEALEERKTAFNALSAQLKSREAELALTQQQASEYKDDLENMRGERSLLLKQTKDEIQVIKREKSDAESRLVREISDLKDINFAQEGRSLDLEQRNSSLQEQVYDLKEELTATQAEVKLQATQAQEKLQKELHRHKDAQRALSQQHSDELARLQQTNEETEQSYKERIQRLEEHRRAVEEELTKVKGQQLAERVTFQEQLMQAKQKVKEEEQQRSHQLEDRLRMVQLSKDELQQQYSQQGHQITENQARLTNANMEIETLKRKLQELTQELAGKNSETEATVTKIEERYKRQIGRLKGQVQEMEQVKDECSRLEQEMTEQGRKHQAELSRKEGAILSLQDQVRRLEFEMVQVRDEEAQRANALQAAITTYVQATPRSPMVTPRKL